MAHFVRAIHVHSMHKGGTRFTVHTNRGHVIHRHFGTPLGGHHYARLIRGHANGSFTCRPEGLIPQMVFERWPTESQEAENREHSCPGERTPGWCRPWPPGDFSQCEFFARKDGCWQTWDAGGTRSQPGALGTLRPFAASEGPRTHNLIIPKPYALPNPVDHWVERQELPAGRRLLWLFRVFWWPRIRRRLGPLLCSFLDHKWSQNLTRSTDPAGETSYYRHCQRCGHPDPDPVTVDAASSSGTKLAVQQGSEGSCIAHADPKPLRTLHEFGSNCWCFSTPPPTSQETSRPMPGYCFIVSPELYQEIDRRAQERGIATEEMLLIILQEYLLPGHAYNLMAHHGGHLGCDCRTTPAGTFHSQECLERMAAPAGQETQSTSLTST